MTRWATNSLAVVMLATALFYLLLEPERQGDAVPAVAVAEGASEAVAPLATAPAIAPERVAPFVSSAQPPEVERQRPNTGLDPMLVMGRGEFADRQIEAYNERHVLPFNPEVGQECRELPDPQFPGQYYRSCQTLREHPAHPYQALPHAELAHLAVHDAAASMVLAERAVDEQERLYWHLRAAALAEKTGPLMRLAERRYGAPYRLRSVDGATTTVPDTDAMATRLALETVAARLGDPRANPQQRRLELLEATGTRSKPTLQRVDALVAEFLEHMAEVQQRITGSVQVREIMDV